MNDLFGFIITRHVNSVMTNKYWNHSLKLIRTFYPETKIIIIDDNSNYSFVKSEFDYKNIQIIQSEFPGRGELLPYCYFLKYKFFTNAVILHDSVFFHKRINFEKLIGIDVIPFWIFNSDTENVQSTNGIIRSLRNYKNIESKISTNITIDMGHQKWFGCFGVQSFINLKFLERIENIYGITNLVNSVKCRSDRCCLERILGCIFFTESPTLYKKNSIFGDIRKYQRWGYSYDEYMQDLKKNNVPCVLVKVWTGR
jgi:hypothetical protein